MRVRERHMGEARLSGGMREGFVGAGHLPSGVRLYRIGADGTVLLADRDGARELGPDKDLLRFIDDGQFAHYLVGDAKTSPERPSNATVKLGIVGPRSAFTPTPTAASTTSSASATPPADCTTPNATASPKSPSPPAS
ncbi:hypothetical protein [Streptomyces acidiscabies]|uniref:hypothetical protein n=1 Tax=Streptomyces acidiscabies TaxID=42234 RepID=UPI002FF04B3F